ncbi:MAG TPA: methyltransferase domain-containing protein [Polyangiaceae bacterium]|nr:methyltransferase domain-containing protein [Polyangiaceae bacterium]
MNDADSAEAESERLLAEAFDPGTLRWLSPRVHPGSHCLVLGPGTEPIVRWLEQVVGPDGRVTPLEIRPRSWCQVSSESPQVPSSVIHQLITNAGPFDLVHVRFAMVHALKKDELLGALVEAVRPGGLLVVEEPDFGSARALTGPEKARRSFNNVQSAMELVFATLGLDHAIGSRIPDLLQQHGFENISIENDAAIVPGKSPRADVMAMSATQLATALIATGFPSPNDIERYRDFANHPTCWATYLSIIRGAGVRPVG